MRVSVARGTGRTFDARMRNLHAPFFISTPTIAISRLAAWRSRLTKESALASNVVEGPDLFGKLVGAEGSECLRTLRRHGQRWL